MGLTRPASSDSGFLVSRPRRPIWSGLPSNGFRHARDPSHARPDHRLRPGGLHRGDLRGARQPVADPGGRAGAGRATDDHHRRRELPGLRRGDPGALADGADGGAGRACRHAHRARPDHPGRFHRAPVPLRRRFGRGVPGRRGDHRHRRAGPLARHRVRSSGCKAAACRPAPPATGSSTAARRWRWSAAATPRSRRRCT